MIEKRILVVDDDKVVLEMLAKCFMSAGYSTAQAMSGKDALFLSKDWKPDLIILDIMMPDMDGIEVARELKKDPHTKHIPIIFLSSLISKKEEKQAVPKWGNSYMAKPYVKDELLKEVEKHI